MDSDDETTAKRMEHLRCQTLAIQAQLDQLQAKLDHLEARTEALKQRARKLRFQLVDVVLAFLSGALCVATFFYCLVN